MHKSVHACVRAKHEGRGTGGSQKAKRGSCVRLQKDETSGGKKKERKKRKIYPRHGKRYARSFEKNFHTGPDEDNYTKRRKK